MISDDYSYTEEELLRVESELRERAEAISETQPGIEAEIAGIEDALREVDEPGSRKVLLDMLADAKAKLAQVIQESGKVVAAALYHDTHHKYTPADVTHWYAEAYEHGAGADRVTPTLVSHLVHLKAVPNAPFRAEVQGVSDEEELLMAENLQAWFTTFGLPGTFIREPVPGSTRATTPQPAGIYYRLLGMKPYPAGGKMTRTHFKLFVSYEQADAMRRALNMTPQQAGI